MSMTNFLDYASQKYHEGNPIISDAEFDRLAEYHDYTSVGYTVRHGVAHTFPMYSLQKVYVGEKEIHLNGETIETPKLDGAAISLLYVEGKLMLALTRGDGKRGEDITDKARLYGNTNLENFRPKLPPILQVIGEVVAPKTIPNSRNYAAGALNLKSLEEFASRDTRFIAYGVTPSLTKTYRDDMQLLMLLGFSTVAGDCDLDEYPQDGKVIRLNSNAEFDKAGYTSSHPRGAYALKTRTEGVVTTLRDVAWQVGRTGVVSPVAILDPVKVGDATVSRATLHNMRYIEELGLEIGCQVEIIRSGEIIPRVVRRV